MEMLPLSVGDIAYFDDEGLQIGDQNQPANAVANQLAKQVLEQSGCPVSVTLGVERPERQQDAHRGEVFGQDLAVR